MIDILFSQGIFVFLIVLLSLVIAISIHEFAHAYIAYKLGDPTPKLQGRVTLNPLKHLDLLGTALLIFFGFGWGKPVRFDPFNLRDPKKDSAIISLAGPVSNLIIALLFSILIRLMSNPFSTLGFLRNALSLVVFYNVILAVFNLIPIHPLDGGKIFVGLLPDDQAAEADLFLRRYGIIILFFLIFPTVGGTSPVFLVISPIIDFFLNILLPNTPFI